MGGMGSGRRGGKDVTSDYRQLDVRKLHKAGVLVPGYVGAWTWYRNKELRAFIEIEAGDGLITLRYSATQQGLRKGYNYPVRLSWTPCTYGGARPWFRCPRCTARVAILYGGAEFVCRHCRRLTYEVQRESDNDRVIRRADAIRARLGWPPGIANPTLWKPKGMHWRTFWRLRAEYDQLVRTGFEGLAVQLGIADRKLSHVERLLHRSTQAKR